MGQYDAILHMDKPADKKHKPMSIHNRAAQFAPFDALTGFSEQIYETARLTDARIELSEEAKASLDLRLRILEKNIGHEPLVTITYFLADKKKEGGIYQTRSCRIKKLLPCEECLQLEDDTRICFEDILSIDSPLLSEADVP